MSYSTQQDILDFVEDNNVKFVRFAFCDIFGTQKNIAVLANDLPKALEDGVCFDEGVTANARNGSIDARIKIAVDIKSRRHQRSGKPPHGIADELLIALAVRFEPICIVVKSDFKQETESFRRKSIKYFFAVHIRVFAGCLLMICRNLPVLSRSETAAQNGLFNRSGFAA